MTDATRVGLVLAAFFAAGAISSAYLPLWFADHGLTAAEIGLVLGVSSLLRVAAVPGGGWVADRLGRRPLVVMAAAGLAGASAATLPLLHGVGPLLGAMVVFGAAASLLAPLTDAVTLALSAAGRLEYGRTRAWGSIAYMAATAGAGWLLVRTGTASVPWLLAGGYAAAALFALRLPDVTPPARRQGAAAGPFRIPAFRLALVATALIQGSHAAYYSFAPLHWRAAGISDGTIGLLIAEGIVAEIALFLWGRAWIERMGPARLTALAAAACLVRWTATAATTDIAALAAVQLLHAVTFACQHLSAMLVLRGLPAERAAMAQTLMAALGFSLPTAVLVWVSGQLYAPLGGLVFLPMAAVGGAALLTVAGLWRVQQGPPPRR